MKKYLFPLLLFFCTYLVVYLLFSQLDEHLTKEITTTILKVILGIAFYVYTIKLVSNTKELFSHTILSKKDMQLIIFLAALFMLNNYFQARFSSSTAYMKSQLIGVTILNFILNSFFEEFAYRGFIQGYVNQSIKKIRFPISQGNLFASILMLIPHLGFFVVKDTIFAITGFILVFIFSLTAGYLRDKGMSVWYLIILHTFVNGVHLLLNLEHYL